MRLRDPDPGPWEVERIRVSLFANPLVSPCVKRRSRWSSAPGVLILAGAELKATAVWLVLNHPGWPNLAAGECPSISATARLAACDQECHIASTVGGPDVVPGARVHRRWVERQSVQRDDFFACELVGGSTAHGYNIARHRQSDVGRPRHQDMGRSSRRRAVSGVRPK